ncbi:MFS transporter [Bacillus paralicheniformis]|uniref:MFS transporter n=2 Tax=Bacillus paralicheniformis TaxID=1648923 RepID=UPI002244EAD2|nr:MFS transporter [Bacillus paralicheniformis]MEC1021677.1 MFS transporter [Bacillus paralicheniformis]MEC1028608.1 MFS transporter [Bacillus paralicheniformis]MEC1033019.1 MFS transporter [Bacillus paralicheniformis]MEC1051957.1 MFS transporter [Bacillus paralicheniformis]MEC1061284.1 MFS transporter [Bacillus paralicheniformis]
MKNSKTQSFKHQKKAFWWLSFVAFFSVMNETVFNVSLPDIRNQFGVSPAAANWVNTSFIISFAAGSVVYSRLSDMYGVRKLFVAGLIIYGGGSLIGLLAQPYFPAVIFARYVRPEGRGKAFGLVGSLVAMGEGIGPAIGGMIVHHIHWSFLFLLPMAALMSIPFFLRNIPAEAAAKANLDIMGIGLLTISIVMFAVFISLYHVFYLAAGIFCLIGAAVHTRYAEHPFIDRSLMKNRRYIGVVLAGCTVLGSVAGIVSVVPYMMRVLFNLNADMIGSGIILPGSVGVIFFGVAGGALTDRFGSRFVFTVGWLVILAAMAAASQFGDRTPWLMTIMLVFIFGGLSFVKTAISNSTAESLEEEAAGAGMGMLNFACFLSEGIGVAFAGGLMAVRGFGYFALPSMDNAASAVFSRSFAIFTVFILAGGLLYLWTCKRKKS